MTKNPERTRFSWEDLLELSMSVGKHLELSRSTQVFIDCLRKKITFIEYELWQVKDDRLYPFYPRFNESTILKSYAPKNVSLLFPIYEEESFRTLSAEQLLNIEIQPKIPNLEYRSIRLHADFFLLLTFDSSDEAITASELTLLLPILQRFGVAIQLHQEKLSSSLPGANEIDKISQDLEANNLILENITEGILICDLNSKILYTNNRILELAEHNRNEVLGKNIQEIPLLNDYKTELQIKFEKVLNQGEQFEFFVPVRRNKSNNEFWAKGNLSPYRNKKGEIIGAIALVRDITNEVLAKNTEQTLKKTKDQYDLVINQGFDGVLSFDLNSEKLLNVNEALLQKMGYTSGEFLQAQVEELSPEFQPNGLTSKTYLSNINHQIKKSKNRKINYEWVHKRKDGTLYYVEVIAVRLEAPNDHIKIEIHQDITQRYLAQKELQENRERLNQFFDRSPIAVHIRSIDSHNFERVNQKFTQLFGYTVDELNEKTRRQLVFDEDTAYIKKQMERLYKKEIQSFRTVKQYIRKDGSRFWGAATRSLVELKDETLLIGFIEDITEQKNAEKLILESNQRYQDLFDNMYDALLTVNPEGKFLNANKASERILGYSLDEIQQLNIQDIIHPDDKEKSDRYLDKLKKEGFYSNYQGRIITKKGKVKYVQVNSNVIIENGKIIGSRDIARDITELKITEQKKEQLFKELEQANKQLKDFAYIVSHDLKAPLRAISTLSNWIAEDYKDLIDEEGKYHLELLTSRANRMQNFIEGILQYSRLGRTKMVLEKVNPNRLIDEIIRDLNLPKQFNISVENKLPVIKAQNIRIQQVFQNLISNAVKYNDKEFGQIKISYDSTKTHHWFHVEDNGQGIEEKHYEKIFQIFQTLQPRDELESTGVGLTIVKKIVELHDGEITLKSKPRMGTTFSFSIAKFE
jgi:PAS domain S-box-containing protein